MLFRHFVFFNEPWGQRVKSPDVRWIVGIGQNENAAEVPCQKARAFVLEKVLNTLAPPTNEIIYAVNRRVKANGN